MGVPQNATWKMVPVASLHEDPTNARAHGEANRRAVRSSLAEFGQVETLVVTPEGRVLGGNCRLGELRALGVEEVMVAEVALGGHDATRLGLVLNRTAELATWDEDNLEALLRDLDAEDAADGLGWDEGELEDILREEGPPTDPGPQATAPVIEGDVAWTVYHGDSLEVLKTWPANSVDSVVTDPPYGLEFMGKEWDDEVPGAPLWREVLRVLKPGGYLLAFAGTRTQHKMATAIEEGGFEIRDMIAWVYGSGFPKSHDVSKAIDKVAGVEREVVGHYTTDMGGLGGERLGTPRGDITAPLAPEAKRWEGWGTALKPALEPITVARKPLEGTVAANVTTYGTGALNIDGCRVPAPGEEISTSKGERTSKHCYGEYAYCDGGQSPGQKLGRFPANFVHDGSPEVLALFPETGPSTEKVGSAIPSGSVVFDGRGHKPKWGKKTLGDPGGLASGALPRGLEIGSAARYFYCAKTSVVDRGPDNNHPTVKPTDLMAYLCRLVTQPKGLILDPFCGSGSTGRGAVRGGFSFAGIERDIESVEISRRRIAEEAARSVGEGA